MCFLPQDERHLSRALKLAREAAAFASPNPTVGCVLTLDDTAIGEGAHLYERRDHAEIAALKHATGSGHSTHGATAYVTLEPCSHHGRTGPCADALITAGISRCVIGTVDPNPQVSGSGIAKLRAAGVSVCVAETAAPLAQQARRLNEAFAFGIVHGRPFVTLKAALSVDGKLAPPLATRIATAPHWLTGPAARADVQRLRHHSDAVLTGIGTVLADNPSLTDRTGLPRRRPLLRVVLDSALRTPLTSALLQPVGPTEDADVLDVLDVLIVCAANAPAEAEAALRARGAQVHRLPATPALGERLAPAAVLAALAERDIRSVLLEAGSAVNGSFLRAKLVDKVILYYAETELGANAVPFAADAASPYLLQRQLTSVTRQTFPNGNAEDVRISGYLHDPWLTRL